MYCHFILLIEPEDQNQDLLKAYKAEKEELSKYRDKLQDKHSELTKTGKYSRSFYLLKRTGRICYIVLRFFVIL